MEATPFTLDELPEESLNDPKWPTLSDYLEEYYAQMGTQGPGLKTYFDEFDKKLEGGLRGIVIIGGEPGSGKTALALQIGLDTALDEAENRAVLIYSFEMPKSQLVTRLFQRAGKIKYTKMQTRVENMIPDDHRRFLETQVKIKSAASRIIIRENKDFFQVKDGGVSVHFDFSEHIKQIQQIAEEYGKPPLVIIDSLHEIPVDLKSAELKQKIDHLMLNLRFMCDQTGSTFLLISHQSRSGQKEGGLNSYLGSASIEYTVDMALSVVVPVRKESNERDAREVKLEGERELVVNKNRYGPKPKAVLGFDGQFMDFSFWDLL